MAFVGILLLASCASKKAVVTEKPVKTATDGQPAVRQDVQMGKLSFVQKVSDNQVYAKNIVGDLSFHLQAGSEDITVPGALRMRKDEVIRLQLFIPLLGSEVGRLEFTPTYVLVIDRIHKQYVKADYTQISFLRDNGLTFYSLQALFWNQLLLPGKQKVSESDLKAFDVNLQGTGATLPVTLKSGSMSYQWNAERATGRISSTNVVYQSKTHGTSTLDWQYDNFKSVGVKMFPALQVFKFTTTATSKKRVAQVTLDMDKVTTDGNWEATSTVSPKYKKMEAEDILGKLLKM